MPETVRTDEAPSFEQFDLPISQAVVHGDTVYVAGQAGVDPETGELVDGGVAAETRQTMENVRAILEAAGSSLEQIVDVTVYVDDMDDFEAVNEAYAEYVSEPYPARSAVEVGDLAMELSVELEVVAAT